MTERKSEKKWIELGDTLYNLAQFAGVKAEGTKILLMILLHSTSEYQLSPFHYIEIDLHDHERAEYIFEKLSEILKAYKL